MNCKGTAIILHRRWAKCFRAFHPMNERTSAIDMKIAGRFIRLIAIYMPTAWNADSEVEDAYASLTDLCIEGLKRGRCCFIVGDFNAVVGPSTEVDDRRSVGEHGIGTRNDRGKRLVEWATGMGLSIANTFFKKPFDRAWTHLQDGRRRQIDYCVATRSKKCRVRDVEAGYDINVGIDHRCLRVDLDIDRLATNKHKKAKPKRTPNLVGWSPRDRQKFEHCLDAKVDKLMADPIVKSLEERCNEIDVTLLELARECSAAQETITAEEGESRSRLRSLIGKRKRARISNDKVTEKTASKQIQKEMRAITKARKRAKITTILERFQGLKFCSGHQGERQTQLHRISFG